jgi:hypothetical protein
MQADNVNGNVFSQLTIFETKMSFQKDQFGMLSKHPKNTTLSEQLQYPITKSQEEAKSIPPTHK